MQKSKIIDTHKIISTSLCNVDWLMMMNTASQCIGLWMKCTSTDFLMFKEPRIQTNNLSPKSLMLNIGIIKWPDWQATLILTKFTVRYIGRMLHSPRYLSSTGIDTPTITNTWTTPTLASLEISVQCTFRHVWGYGIGVGARFEKLLACCQGLGSSCWWWDSNSHIWFYVDSWKAQRSLSDQKQRHFLTILQQRLVPFVSLRLVFLKS